MLFIERKEEQRKRWGKINIEMEKLGADALLVSSKVNNFYVAGRIFMGYSLIMKNGRVIFFVRRPLDAEGEEVVYIKKPADMVAYLNDNDIMPKKILFEDDKMSVNDFRRLQKMFLGVEFSGGGSVLSYCRSIKTPYEMELIKISGDIHSKTYSAVPEFFKEGMTDRQLSLLVENRMRENGSIGVSRIAGDTMEIHVCTVLVGNNADAYSPYDFATTGGGVDSSFPVGYNGTKIKQGMSIMVDGCANKHGYLSDMTRVFAVGELSDLALHAYATSVAIYHEMVKMIEVGTKCSDIYNKAFDMAKEAGLSEYFMGHKQQAGFVGHGVGIELNEAPVIAPRSRSIVEMGMVMALEPKFVIPEVGVMGMENTVALTEKGVIVLTEGDYQLKQLL
ncbi:MAG: aminopeptidase P family protein [Bacteroidetes bacterium]|nr:aminopeptidase P family protein [Bacteroidota bacterium]